MSAPSGPSDTRDPARWKDDPSAPSEIAADLRAALKAAPTSAQIAAIAKSVRSAGGPAASEAPPPPAAPAAPPPTQAYWGLGAKFWVGVLAPVCAVAFWLGQSSRSNAPSSIASDAPRARHEAQRAPAMPIAAPPERPPSAAQRVLSSDAGAAVRDTLTLNADAPRVRAARPCIDAEHRASVSRAQSLVARGEHRAALAQLSPDRLQCPAGAMAEDRERLAIEALLRSGDDRAARARWRVFQRTFPRSLYARTLSVLLASEPR